MPLMGAPAGATPAESRGGARPFAARRGSTRGCAGLAPCMAAIEQGRTVALANKEALVSAGDVMLA